MLSVSVPLRFHSSKEAPCANGPKKMRVDSSLGALLVRLKRLMKSSLERWQQINGLKCKDGPSLLITADVLM